MSTIAQFSLDHYEHMVNVGAFAGEYKKRVELIRGEIVQMTPINIAHANCVTRVTDQSARTRWRDNSSVATIRLSNYPF